MSDNLTITMTWGPRSESARECADRIVASIAHIPAQRDLFSTWLVVPDDGATGPADFLPLPTSLSALTDLVQSSRLRDDRGRVMDGGGFTLGLVRLHMERPVKYWISCGVERPHLSNHVQFDLPHPDHADSATESPDIISSVFTALVEAWRPTHASVMTYEFRKAQQINRRSDEIPVGWLTYLSGAVVIDRAALPTAVSESTLSDGIVLTLPGTPREPSLDDALEIRRALGYSDS